MRDRVEDLSDKVRRLAEVGRQRQVDTLVLREPATLTWLLEARVHVPQTLDTACLDVMLDLDRGSTQEAASPRITIVTNAIEAPRLRDELLRGHVPAPPTESTHPAPAAPPPHSGG